jgi:hypothetical protein
MTMQVTMGIAVTLIAASVANHDVGKLHSRTQLRVEVAIKTRFFCDFYIDFVSVKALDRKTR